MGTIFKRGKIFWIQYYQRGKPIRETSHSTEKRIADRLLKKREGEIVEGKLPGVYFDKVTFQELAEDFLNDYLINNRKSLTKAERRVTTLQSFFGAMKAPEITTPKVKAYIAKRMSEGKKNATINRELAALKRMFSLGAKYTPPKVSHIPYITMLKENNVRKGFFEYEDFLALREKLPAYLYGFCTFAYKTGWRYGEIKAITWSQVDRVNGIVVLNPGETKNNEARTIYLDEELKDIFRHLWAERRLGCPYVFHLKGKPLGDFRYSWNKAAKEVGLPGMIFHDLRRTAVRNMVRAGVPEVVAMKISGHKTRSVFDRYNIVSQEDLRGAAQKQEEYLGLQKLQTQNRHNLENWDKKRDQPKLANPLIL
jgi:integrase